MSISPIDAQRSKSSSSSSTLIQNPNFDHGFLQVPELIRSPISNSTDIHTLGSGSDSVADRSAQISGPMDSVAADSSGSSKKVADKRTPDSRKSTRRQYRGNHSHYHSAGQVGTSSQFRYDQVGSVQTIGELSGAVTSQQNQPTSRTIGFHGSAAHSTGKKNQTMNANHLLNFHYDRVSRPQPRIPPPRRQQKIRPYNKDLFLQANYRFVVLDSGNYAVESMDADKMLQWENVICVRYSTPYPVQCPICLESPLCPQITSCGHIFCFPCILRYLLMGEEDHKGDCWKKCPLCFMMISLKDLYTIYIENVKHYRVGDIIQFTLLTRQKNSLIPLQKNQQGIGSMDCDNIDLCDSFSKFSLTSDVELSVREAYSELKEWLARAESGLVDDVQQLPYVCAALEQLEQRKTFWTDIRSLSSSPPVQNPTPYSNIRANEYSELKCLENSTPIKLDGEESVVETGELPGTDEGEEKVVSSSYEEEKNLQRHFNGTEDIKEKDSYSFYQAVDGQHLILHPLNMKCLLHYYGSYDLLPPRISGKILQLETVTQSEDMRRRYRYLSHFSLTTTFQLCEIDISEILPPDALLPFMDEIKKRENQRKQLIKKEQQEKIKAEAASMHAIPIPSNFGHFPCIEKSFSMDDFEALGSAPSSSSPPLTSERKRFSDVTRLGFAAAHDSPSLKAEESANVSSNQAAKGETSGLAGQRKLVTLSFANVISTAKSPESKEIPKMDGLVGKKGKKPTRVLLSTAGGRRY